MAKTSDQKARVYSKHARVIYVTGKQGGTDPDGNLALRSAIERAKHRGERTMSETEIHGGVSLAYTDALRRSRERRGTGYYGPDVACGYRPSSRENAAKILIGRAYGFREGLEAGDKVLSVVVKM